MTTTFSLGKLTGEKDEGKSDYGKGMLVPHYCVDATEEGLAGRWLQGAKHFFKDDFSHLHPYRFSRLMLSLPYLQQMLLSEKEHTVYWRTGVEGPGIDGSFDDIKDLYSNDSGVVPFVPAINDGTYKGEENGWDTSGSFWESCKSGITYRNMFSTLKDDESWPRLSNLYSSFVEQGDIEHGVYKKIVDFANETSGIKDVDHSDIHVVWGGIFFYNPTDSFVSITSPYLCPELIKGETRLAGSLSMLKELFNTDALYAIFHINYLCSPNRHLREQTPNVYSRWNLFVPGETGATYPVNIPLIELILLKSGLD